MLVGAGLALLPAVTASADPIDDLAVAAADARTAADAADVSADEADAAASAAAADATALRGAADAAQAASDAAAAADPLDQAAADAAALAATDADVAADAAESTAADAADAAVTARANADSLEAAAVAAEAAHAAAVAAGTPPPEEEAPAPPEAKTVQTFDNPCDNGPSLEQQDSFVVQDFDWCIEPWIDIDVVNICPTVIEVEIGNLKHWLDYTVRIEGDVVPIEIVNGKAYLTISDFGSGDFDVSVTYGLWHWSDTVYRDKDIKEYDCPKISAEIWECDTIDGQAEVYVEVWDLSKWADYTITITGPDGYYHSGDVSWAESWSDWFSLDPGDYVVTVTGESRHYDIGPVVYEFTVAPCPGDIVITITPTCAATGSGSLGAVLSDLVIGREYHVTVTGPNGVVTDVTFVADSTTWNVPPASLPPGTYTVTVVDTNGYEDWGLMVKQEQEQERYNLTWEATGTITSCPPVPTLASTGMALSGATLPGLLLLPLGAVLLVTRRVRARKQPLE